MILTKRLIPAIFRKPRISYSSYHSEKRTSAKPVWPSPSGSNDNPAGVVLRRIADGKQENHKIENETKGKFNQNNIFSLHQTDIEK